MRRRITATAITVVILLAVAIGANTRSQAVGGTPGTPGTPAIVPTCGWRSPGPCVVSGPTQPAPSFVTPFPTMTPTVDYRTVVAGCGEQGNLISCAQSISTVRTLQGIYPTATPR